MPEPSHPETTPKREPTSPARPSAFTRLSARENWAYLLIGSVSLTLLVILGLALSRPQVVGGLDTAPSTFFTTPDGARALLLVLEKLLPEVSVWRRPLEQLPDPGEGEASTLIIAAPKEPLTPAEADRLESWIEQGGQLILATRGDWEIVSEEETPTPRPTPTQTPTSTPTPTLTPRPASPDASTLATPPQPTMPTLPNFDETPGFLARLGLTFRRDPDPTAPVSHWEALPPGQELRRASQDAPHMSLTQSPDLVMEGEFEPLLLWRDRAVAVAVRAGAGRAVVISDAGFFTNRGLRRGDNAVWVVQLIHAWGNQKVLFDEFHHGFGAQQSMWSLIGQFVQTPFGFMFLQLGLAGLLYVLGVKARQGRVVLPTDRPERSPLAQVMARGRLYQEAQSRHLAVELMCQQLCHELARPLGLLNWVPGADGTEASDGGRQRRELNLTTLYPALTARQLAASTQKQLERLLSLYQRAVQRESLSDAQVLEVGQLTARIPREVLSGIG